MNESTGVGRKLPRSRERRPSALPRHVWLVDEATNSRKPPMIALLLELRRIENDGPAHSRAAEPHWRGLVAVAYPGGGMRVWWERTEVLIPFAAWPAPVGPDDLRQEGNR